MPVRYDDAAEFYYEEYDKPMGFIKPNATKTSLEKEYEKLITNNPCNEIALGKWEPGPVDNVPERCGEVESKEEVKFLLKIMKSLFTRPQFPWIYDFVVDNPHHMVDCPPSYRGLGPRGLAAKLDVQIKKLLDLLPETMDGDK